MVVSFTGTIINNQKSSNIAIRIPLHHSTSSGNTFPMIGTSALDERSTLPTSDQSGMTENACYGVKLRSSPAHLNENVFKSECSPKTFNIPMTENDAHGTIDLEASPPVSDRDMTENVCYGLQQVPTSNTKPEYVSVSDLQWTTFDDLPWRETKLANGNILMVWPWAVKACCCLMQTFLYRDGVVKIIICITIGVLLPPLDIEFHKSLSIPCVACSLSFNILWELFLHSQQLCLWGSFVDKWSSVWTPKNRWFALWSLPLPSIIPLTIDQFHLCPPALQLTLLSLSRSCFSPLSFSLFLSLLPLFSLSLSFSLLPLFSLSLSLSFPLWFSQTSSLSL